MKVKWSENSKHTTAWGIKVFHRIDSKCVRKNVIVSDSKKGFAPCRKCFPTTMWHKMEE